MSGGEISGGKRERERFEERLSEKNLEKMTTGIVKDQQKLEKQIEKQMGCMAGFLQIFDRHQIITGKRIYSSKRLPPTPVSFLLSPLCLFVFVMFC